MVVLSLTKKLVKKIEANLQNGKAFEYFKVFLAAQGGNVDVVDNPEKLPQATILHDVKAPQDGFVKTLNQTKSVFLQ